MTIIEEIEAGKVDEADLLEYITDNDFNIALAATKSPLATAVILRVAACDRDKRIRIAALNNKNISDDTVKLLCKDEDLEVRTIAENELERRTL